MPPPAHNDAFRQGASMLYTVLKFVHILLAIIGIGFTSTFGLL